MKAVHVKVQLQCNKLHEIPSATLVTCHGIAKGGDAMHTRKDMQLKNGLGGIFAFSFAYADMAGVKLSGCAFKDLFRWWKK